MECTTAQLAEILGLSDRRIQQLVKVGAIPKLDRNQYDLAAAIQSYLEFIKLQYEDTETELDLKKEKALLTRANRHKVELELKIMRGELHRAEDVERVMNDMLASFRARCLAIPTKAAPLIVGQEDLVIIQDIIKKEIHEALSELSDYDPDVFYSQSKDKLVLEHADDNKENKRQDGRT